MGHQSKYSQNSDVAWVGWGNTAIISYWIDLLYIDIDML